MLFQNWRKYAPLLFFNREVDIITEEDITKVNLIKNKFFSEDTNNKPPAIKGTYNIQLFRIRSLILSLSSERGTHNF